MLVLCQGNWADSSFLVSFEIVVSFTVVLDCILLIGLFKVLSTPLQIYCDKVPDILKHCSKIQYFYFICVDITSILVVSVCSLVTMLAKNEFEANSFKFSTAKCKHTMENVTSQPEIDSYPMGLQVWNMHSGTTACSSFDKELLLRDRVPWSSHLGPFSSQTSLCWWCLIKESNNHMQGPSGKKLQ